MDRPRPHGGRGGADQQRGLVLDSTPLLMAAPSSRTRSAAPTGRSATSRSTRSASSTTPPTTSPRARSAARSPSFPAERAPHLRHARAQGGDVGRDRLRRGHRRVRHLRRHARPPTAASTSRPACSPTRCTRPSSAARPPPRCRPRSSARASTRASATVARRDPPVREATVRSTRRSRTRRFCPRCGNAAEVDYPRSISCPHCGYGAYYNPKPVAAAIPVTAAGEIVLLRRGFDPGKGLWTFPGGFVDLGETVEEAARREAVEEIRAEVAARRAGGRLFARGGASGAHRLRRHDRRGAAHDPRGATGRGLRARRDPMAGARLLVDDERAQRLPRALLTLRRAVALAAVVVATLAGGYLALVSFRQDRALVGRHDPAQRLPRPQGRARRLRAARRLGRALRGDPAARAAARRPAHDRPQHGQEGRDRRHGSTSTASARRRATRSPPTCAT